MAFVTFLKRLVGQDQEAIDTERRFKARLQDVDDRTSELAAASKAIEAILCSVETKSENIAISVASSGVSGEHRITLPAEQAGVRDDAREDI
jgi:hypothetical protein